MKEDTKKQRILQEGFVLMREKGFRATSIDEILLRLFIPKDTFFFYFKTKEEFTVEVLQYYAATVYKHMGETLKNREIKPIPRIVGLYSDYIDQYVNSEVVGYGNFASKIIEEIGDDYPEIHKAANDIFDHIKLMHSRCLSDAMATGQIRRNFDAVAMAEFIINGWEGALRRMKVTKNVKPLFIFREILKNNLLK